MRLKILFIIVLMTLLTNASCTSKAVRPDTVYTRSTLGQERLIGKDLGKGSSFSTKWCGNNALLLDNQKIGVVLHDLKTGKSRTIINKAYYNPINCTPDGKWVLYSKSVLRDVPKDYIEKQRREGVHENYIFDEERWWEVYRYDVERGESYLYAETKYIGTMSPSLKWLSPDGKRIYLGSTYNIFDNVPGPTWEAVSFTKKGLDITNYTYWLSDSSGLITIEIFPLVVNIETFGKDASAETFEFNLNPVELLGQATVDDHGRVYLVATDTMFPSDEINTHLYQCIIESKELRCKEVFQYNEFGNYEILPDGDILFGALYEKCIFRLKPDSNTKPECVIEHHDEKLTYQDAFLGDISPDRKSLIFERRYGMRSNLYLIEINNQ